MDTSSLLPSKMPVWVYRLIAVFPTTGFLGVDHFAIGSKETGMAKALINLLTFGSWYFFDIAQSLDTQKVVKDGLGIPFYGDVGIGKGNLTDGYDASSNFWLKILFLFAGFSIAGFATLFVTQPNPGGAVAKAIAGTATAISVSILGYLLSSFFSTSLPIPALPGISGIPGVSLLQGGASPQPEPQGTTFTELLTLGTLAAVTITGFVLHKTRST